MTTTTSTCTKTPDPFITDCPRWCTAAGDHSHEWAPEQRTHYSTIVRIDELELEPSTRTIGGEVVTSPLDLTVHLEQHYRAVQPDMVFELDDRAMLRLTLAEAAALAAAVTSLLEGTRA